MQQKGIHNVIGAEVISNGKDPLSERLIIGKVDIVCHQKRLTAGKPQHGAKKPRLSDYGLQLREKQKIRRIYGVLERQFRRYFAEAARRKGVAADVVKYLDTAPDLATLQDMFAKPRSDV